MRNKLLIIGIFSFLLFSLAGCNNEDKQITELSMLGGGKTFAVVTGTAADQFVLGKFPDAKLKYYNSILDAAIAVRDGKADATVYDKPIVQNIVAKNDGLAVLPELLMKDKFGIAVQLQNKELKTAIDDTVKELKANGTYDDMMKRWFPKQGNPAPMPDIKLTGDKGTLRLGFANSGEPIAYIDSSNKFTGFDIELATYIAQKLDMQLEVVNMEFSALIPALQAGKIDMIASGISITEERAKKVLFSESYYDGGIAVIVAGKPGAPTGNTSGKLNTVEDLKDKKIGVLLGGIHDEYARKTYPNATVMQYKSQSDLILAVKTGKVDAAFFTHESLLEMMRSDQELAFLGENLYRIPMGMGFNQNNDKLREQFNEFLKQIKGNGVYDDMVDRWVAKGINDMPVIDNTKNNGRLVVGVVSDKGLPFAIVKNNRIVGFDIEMAERFAAYLGKELVLQDMEFASLIAAVASNKIDMVDSTLVITEERKKQIDFSDPYYELGTSVFTLKKNMAKYNGHADQSMAASFMKSISDSFHNNMVVEQRYLLIIDGLKVTALISLLSVLFGTLLGALVCFMRMSKSRLLCTIARIYISILRGTPVLVLLMLIFYVVFASVNIDPVIVAVIAFGLNFGAYVSEMFRTAIESIDPGQTEAGIAGGFTPFQTFIYIVLPQAVRQVLPVYKGEFISLVKMTSVVGYIAVQDLTKASDIIRSRTFDAFFPLVMVAVLYFAMAYLLALVLDYIGLKTDPKRNRLKKVPNAQ
ncbi:MAG: ABC transporter permease subunit [Syntrophomonadaceae bacterium]